MAAPKVYKSTDASAPVLNSVYGSMINLLNAVLVTGYGTKTPLGWTSPYSGGNKAVYVPSLGNDRLFYRVDDNLNYGSWLSVYEAMTSVDNGTGLIPSYASPRSTGGGAILTKYQYDNSTTPIPWCIIGDAYGFYLFTKPGTDSLGYHCGFHYLGQGIDVASTEANGFYICCGATSISSYNDPQFGDFTVSNKISRFHRAWGGGSLGVAIAPHIGSSVPWNVSYSIPNPSPEGKEYLSADVYFGSTDRPYSPRIKMPGLRIGAHTGNALTGCGLDLGDGMLRFAVAPYTGYSIEAHDVRYLAVDISEAYRP